MSRSKQQVLPLELATEANMHDGFIVSLSNLTAYNAIVSERLWPGNRLLVLGERGCGKSHLARIWCAQAGAVEIKKPFHEIFDTTGAAVLLEDIDDCVNEEDLFHAINHTMQEGMTLLMTARTLPEVALPDLRSRLNATQKVIIRGPDDELVRILLRKYFAENQIIVDDSVFEYAQNHIERGFATLHWFVRTLDELSLQEKRAITIPLVKQILSAPH